MKNKIKFNRIFYKIIFNLLFITCITTYSSTGISARVLPEFSGYWYTDVSCQYFDSCYNPVYLYSNKSSDGPEGLAKKLLSDVPVRSDCQWGDVYIDNVYDYTPSDFVGDQRDWEKITSNHQSPMPSEWKRDCTNKDGSVHDYHYVDIQPSYSCPENSRRGLDTTNGSFGCLNPTTPCDADIVGRDLNVPGLGFLGHVGIARRSFTDEIIEVLQEPEEAIYIHSLQDFKNITNAQYWGEKQGLADEKEMDIEKAIRISHAASAQIRYPLEYTYGWDYHPGRIEINHIYNQRDQRWQTINAIKNAKFRCDSFVYYSYSIGGNLNIFPEFKMPFVPLDMFYRFVSCRNNEGKYCSINKTPSVSSQNDKHPLQSLFSAHNIDIRQADYSTQAYINDAHVSRTSKLNQLWSLAIHHQDNPIKFQYLVDILASLKPVELVPEIIQNFQNQTNIGNQHHLLTLLVDLLHVNNQYDLGIANEQLLNIIKIQNFVRDLLYQCKNPDILKYAIQLYPSIASPSDAQRDIQYALTRLNNLHGSVLTEEEKMLTTLRVAFVTHEQQNNLLPGLIEKYQANSMFNHSLCFILSDMSTDQIDSSIKEKLAQQLESQRDNLMESTINPLMSTINTPDCNWLNAYAVVKTHSEAEKEQFMLNYIRNEPDIFMQAGLLTQINGPLVNKLLSPKDKVLYRHRFFEALQRHTFRRGQFDKKNFILNVGITKMRDHP